jgi:hypothetical protein
MRVEISAGAQEYIRRHGGTVFVSSHAHRCCTGSLTLLDVSMAPPGDAEEFESFSSANDAVDGPPIEVRFRGNAAGKPDQLTIELRGMLARRPVAFWDGCAYKP